MQLQNKRSVKFIICTKIISRHDLILIFQLIHVKFEWALSLSLSVVIRKEKY